MTVRKQAILDHLCSGSGLTKTDAERFLGVLVRYIQNQISRGEKINLSGLGAFEAVEVQEKAGRNPKTGERMLISRHKKIRFTASTSLKRIVNAEPVQALSAEKSSETGL